MSNWVRLWLSGARMSFAMFSIEMTPAVLFGSKIPRAVMQALFFVLIAWAAGGIELARFAMIGNLAHAAIFPAVIAISGDVELEKWAGTLPHLIASPANWLPLLMGRSAANYFDSLISLSVAMAVLVPLLGPGITLGSWLLALPVLLLMLVSTSGLGWLLGAISLPTRWGALIANTAAYLMMIFCGINFPFQALPPLVQTLGRCVPMTNGLLAIREVLAGAPFEKVLPYIGLELLVGGLFAALGWLLFRQRLRVARQTGQLEQV